MTKRVKIQCNLEIDLHSLFCDLAQKRGISTSQYLRSMIIDELRLQGTLPDSFAVKLFKGVGSSTE